MISLPMVTKLPVFRKKQEIINALQKSQVIIVAGETGSGKTSQLPLICYEAGFCTRGKIGITQPRRIAATAVADFVARQIKQPLGSFVGYKVRFSDKESQSTKIKFMTDGILLRELEYDKLLWAYDVIIIDEAHERSLQIDFLLGYIKTILVKRPQLRVIISSATINAELFSKAFDNAPVISVSGRMFPIDIYYKPASDDSEDNEADTDYLSAATAAVEEIVQSQQDGDILVFLPTERDILELRDLLIGRLEKRCYVLPLFGRMPLSEQQQIFKLLDKQKIVLATNIAETSVTVPNIHYVVDTGLARVKRYDPAMRITRLPIEPISQASANQRAGRCGRVAEGICIRLYTKEDFLLRPEFTTSEIMRANLGQVILSMSSLSLGAIEKFPFIELPPPRAVSQGYSLLYELGALDKKRNVTHLGKEMAQLPIDPTISRMILEAKKENCIKDVLIIAAGLCVQDMRIRPPDKKEFADTIHRKFTDPMSDFLMYLKIWNDAELSTKKAPTQIRKYCQSNLLSFQRMREWQEVRDQLAAVVYKNDRARTVDQNASYDQIHKSIAAGLVSHIAIKSEDGDYLVAKGRKAFMFPGSSLCKKKPDWIVCGELIETSRLFARCCAAIDPLWLESIADHLCNRSYTEPVFDAESGTVKAYEKVLLFGLPIVERRIVPYGRINSLVANEIFIREGLVSGLLRTQYKFFRHNSDLQKRIAAAGKKMRTSASGDFEETVVAFYTKIISDVTSIHDLNRRIKEQGSDDFLCMNDTDLFVGDTDRHSKDFPDFVIIGTLPCPIQYEFDPQSLHDGATVEIPWPELPYVNETVFDWIVPGFYEPRIRYLLECLPKNQKKTFEPIADTSRKIAGLLEYDGSDFIDSMCRKIQKEIQTELDPSILSLNDLPQHLSIKVLVKKENKPQQNNSGNKNDWQQHSILWEKTKLCKWDFHDIPQKKEIIPSADGFAVYGYPSLVVQEKSVSLKIFSSQEQQSLHHENGVKKLLELCIEKERAWLERDIKIEKHIQVLCAPYGKQEEFRQSLILLSINHVFSQINFCVWKKNDFETIHTTIKKELAATGSQIISVFNQVMIAASELTAMLHKKVTGNITIKQREIVHVLKIELSDYISDLLKLNTNYTAFLQYPRYLLALRYKIDRALIDTTKFIARQESIKPFQEKRLLLLKKTDQLSQEKQKVIFDFIIMVEEFKISVFAQQEIKTLYPVSIKRLEEKWKEIEEDIFRG